MLRKGKCIQFFILVCILFGCSQDESPPLTASKSSPSQQPNQSADNNPQRISTAAVRNTGGEMTISPQNPVSGDCLVVSTGEEGFFTWTLNGMTVQDGASNRYCLEDGRRDDLVVVTLQSASGENSVDVTLGNSLPEILDTQIEYIQNRYESYLEITPRVKDADEDPVQFRYQWFVNNQVNPDYDGNRLYSDGFKAGDVINVVITPEDDFGQGQSYSSREITVPSAAPMITSLPPETFEALEFVYQVEVSDADKQTLSFSLENAPEGMTIDDEGKIVWPLEKIPAGDYSFTVVVTDSEGRSARQEVPMAIQKIKRQQLE